MRRTNWEALLGDYITDNEKRPFEWGMHDCALCVCNMAKELTGVDYAADFRGKYSSALQARRVIDEFCGGDLEALAVKVAEQFGLSEVPVLMAQRGDICLYMTDRGPALGFVSLDGWNVCYPSPDGFTRVPLDKCERAWRVS